MNSYLIPQCLFSAGKLIENFQEFQSSFENAPVERVHFSITCLCLPETTLLELLFAIPNVIFFFTPFSSAIRKFLSYGWGRTLSFVPEGMHAWRGKAFH